MDPDIRPPEAPATGKTTLPPSLAGLTINAAQCAELLFCSQAAVEELASRGELPGTKFGRGWVFLTEQVVKVLGKRCMEEADKRRARSEDAVVPSTRRADRLIVSAPNQRRPAGRKRRPLPTLD